MTMQGFKIVNLKVMVDEIGEDQAREILSNFSCPINEDVENFLKHKSIEFAKQGISQTHLVFASYKGNIELVGYFCLASKYITIQTDALSSTLKRRIKKFSTYDKNIKSYCMSCPLIAQLGKNYTNGLNKIITGDELLLIACDMVASIQQALGGRFVYLECEDTPKLIEFYDSNGFCQFDKRTLDRDETGIKGDYLVQMIKYIH